MTADTRSDYEVIGEMDALLREARWVVDTQIVRDRMYPNRVKRLVELLDRIDRALLSPAELHDRAVRAKEEGRG